MSGRHVSVFFSKLLNTNVNLISVFRLEKIVSFVNENFVFDFNNIFYKEYSDLMISTFGLAPTWKGDVFEQFYIKDHPFAKELTWVDPHFFRNIFLFMMNLVTI